MSTAAIYIRVSSRQQAASEKTSLADQEKECRAYASREGWPVAVAVSDTMTGYETMDQRPALQEVRNLLQSSGADVLLVWRCDRAARDIVDLLVLAREVNNAGAQLVSATEGPVENSAMGRLTLSFRGGAAEIEREAFIARTRGALRTRAESGKLLVGPVPKYGYVYIGERKEGYAINPDTAPIVQRLYQMADDGRGLGDAARTLNGEGVLSPSQYLASIGKLPGKMRLAKGWSRQGIYQVLTDPTYCGRHVAFRFKQVKKGSGKVMKARDEADERRIAQPVPALVSVEQWQRVQAALAGNILDRSGEADQRPTPLLNRGFAVCGHCGARATHAKHHTGYRGYVCPNRSGKQPAGMPPCPGGAWFIRADVLDAEVWARVEEMASDTEQFQRMIMAPLHEAQAKLGQIEQQEKTIADELEQARKDRDTISRRMATEEDDAIAATYRVRMKETLQLITRLEARMGSQDRTSERLRAYLDVMAAAMSVDDGEGEWGIYNPATGETTPIAPPPIAPRPRTYTREQRRNLLRAIGVRVLIYSTKSDYARDNGKRWDMQIIPELYAQESMQKYIMRQTAIDELGLEAAASVQTA